MFVSRSRKLVYVHINKAGGHTIRAFLRSVIPDLECLPWKYYHKPLSFIPPQYRSYNILVGLRSPFTRFESIYSYRSMNQNSPKGREARSLEFNNWLWKTLDSNAKMHGGVDATNFTQAEYIEGRYDDALVNFFRIENAAKDLRPILERLIDYRGPIKLGHRNRSNREERSFNWDTALMYHIHNSEQEIIMRFYPHLLTRRFGG